MERRNFIQAMMALPILSTVTGKPEIVKATEMPEVPIKDFPTEYPTGLRIARCHFETETNNQYQPSLGSGDQFRLLAGQTRVTGEMEVYGLIDAPSFSDQIMVTDITGREVGIITEWYAGYEPGYSQPKTTLRFELFQGESIPKGWREFAARMGGEASQFIRRKKIRNGVISYGKL
jgi:hypothetical protein